MNFKMPSSVFVAVTVHYTEMQNCRSSPALNSCPCHWKLFRWVKPKEESPDVETRHHGLAVSTGRACPLGTAPHLPWKHGVIWWHGVISPVLGYDELPKGPLKVGRNPQLVLVLWSTLRLEQRAVFGCFLCAFTLATAGDDEG